MVAATSAGVHVCWDLRFQLPTAFINHATGARVRRVVCHPTNQSWIISALQGNNEVSMWDVETGAHEKTLWASSAPPLSQTQVKTMCMFLNNDCVSKTMAMFLNIRYVSKSIIMFLNNGYISKMEH